MSPNKTEWLSLTEASRLLGVHQTTLRRWADSRHIPCFRTPGGHRRFRVSDLAAWMDGNRTTSLSPQSDALVRNVVQDTRQEMAARELSGESWYLAFGQEDDRQQMRDTGRRLLGLGIQYMGRTSSHEPVLQEGRRIGAFYGQQCAQREISLVDTMRGFFFFRESLLRATRPGLAMAGQYDAEDVRMHRQLRRFLDEVMYACLSSYEATCRHLLHPGGGA